MPLIPFFLALHSQAAKPIELTRKFAQNEKLAYQVFSHITAEQRQLGLNTWIPEDFDINYGFSFTTEAIKADGIAVLRYLRPTMTEIEGETSDSLPKTKVEKTNMIYRLTISPINELLDAMDIAPKKTPKTKNGSADWAMPAAAGQPKQGVMSLFGPFISEAHRLALFVGGVDSALDFSPKLPLEPVKIGDTWKRTVGYQPQKLKNKDGKSAVQRLDYTYTYLGPMKSENGKPILRVQAKLNLKTDLGDYLKTILAEAAPDAKTNIKTVPLTLDATIDFDLDPVTRHTLSANAQSEGGFSLTIEEESDPVVEERFKGHTSLSLVGRKVEVPVKAKPGAKASR